jgi:hypothetical protein
MNKWFIRIASLTISLALFAGATFFVLSAEQGKRMAQQKVEREQFLADLKEADRVRQEYFAQIDSRRALSQAQMDAAKQQYADLVVKQPELVKQNQQTVTKVVTQTVPVTQKVKVPASQATSTRKTKTS